MSFMLETPADFQKRIAERFKRARLGLNLTRNTLAERSGVAAETIKRFESTGEVSLKYLVRLSFAIGLTATLEGLTTDSGPRTLAELEARTTAKETPRRRGRR